MKGFSCWLVGAVGVKTLTSNSRILTSMSKVNMTPNWWVSKKRSTPFFDVIKKSGNSTCTRNEIFVAVIQFVWVTDCGLGSQGGDCAQGAVQTQWC